MLAAASQTMQDSGAVETIRDLGIPTLVGAALGALIAHYTAKARGREEHEKSLERLRRNDERAHAREALAAVREIRNTIPWDTQSYDVLRAVERLVGSR